MQSLAGVTGPTPTPAFRYPQPAELEESILTGLAPPAAADAPARAAARIRKAGRWFTWSALVPPAAGILLGLGLRATATTLPNSVFWPLAAALCVLIVATELSWRTLVASHSPATATLYYAAACLNRLRDPGTWRGDTQYLTMMLSGLEEQLTSSRLNSQAAGTGVARGHVATVQTGIARRIGEAERAWRQDPRPATVKALRDSIAQAAVVVALDAWFTSRTTAVVGDEPVTLPHRATFRCLPGSSKPRCPRARRSAWVPSAARSCC